MNELVQIYRYLNQHDVRIIMIKGSPWFVLSDVCKILGLADASMTASRLRSHHKGTSFIGTPGGKQRMIVISESGLYKVIMKSNKPEAEKFSDWIADEVIPSIMKTGTYSMEENEWNVLRQKVRDMWAVSKIIHRKVNGLPEKLGGYQPVGAIRDDAELLNKAVFGMTAKEWRANYPELAAKGKNQRDMATNNEMLMLLLAETYNAVEVRHGTPFNERYTVIRDFINGIKQTLAEAYRYAEDTYGNLNSDVIELYPPRSLFKDMDEDKPYGDTIVSLKKRGEAI